MKSCVALLFASLLTLCEAQGTIETPVFVLKGRDLLLKLHADPPQGVLFVDWKINKTVTLVRFEASGKPNVLHNLTGRFEFPEIKFSVKLKNVQEADSGVYSAVAGTPSGDKPVAEYKVTVQGPVSPVELIVDRVDSSSSGSCDLYVTCRTHNSHISSTFRCVDRPCSQEGGERSEVTTSGASLQVYVLNNMIICNHSNQVHWTHNFNTAEHLCSSKPESPIGWVIGVTVLFVIFVVVFVCHYNRHSTKKERRPVEQHLQEQEAALQDLLSALTEEERRRTQQHLQEQEAALLKQEAALLEQEAALWGRLTALTGKERIEQFFTEYVGPIWSFAWEIYYNVKKVKVNKRRSQLVWQRVKALDNLVMSLKEDQASDDVQEALRELKDTLKTALSLIESHTEVSWGERMLLMTDSHEDKFVYMNKRLSDAFWILAGALNEDQIREASEVFDRDSMMKEDEEAKKEDEAELKTQQRIRKQFYIEYVKPIRSIAWKIRFNVEEVKVNKRRSQLVCQRVIALDDLVRSIKEDQTSYDVQEALRELKGTLKTALRLIESHTEDSWGERMLLKADSHEDKFVYVNELLSDAFQILSGVLNEDQIREACKVFDRDSMMKEDEEAKKEDEAELKTPAAAGVNTTAPGAAQS